MTSKFARISLAILYVLSMFVVFPVPKANAVSGNCWFNSTDGPVTGTGGCAVSGYGDYGTNDIMTGRPAHNAIPAIWDGNDTDKQQRQKFVNFVKNKFYNGGTHDRIGAAFIIQTVRGSHAWPNNDMVDNFELRVMQDGVTINRESENIYRSSWYDPGPHNTFYADYAAGAREAIILRQNGVKKVTIEVACANLANNSISITVPPAWGPMKATSAVKMTNDANGDGIVGVGDTVTWTHKVWNNGTIGDDQSPTVSGDVYWGDSTTGRIADRYREPNGNANNRGNFGSPVRALDSQPNPNITYDYSRRFSVDETVIRKYSFTIPAGNASDPTVAGDRWCQYINGNNTSSKDLSNFRSTGVCISVGSGGGLQPDLQPDTDFSGAVEFEEGDTGVARAWVDNKGETTGTANWVRQIWYENDNNESYGAGDLAVTGGFTGAANGTAFGVGRTGPGGIFQNRSVVIASGWSQICTNLILSGINPPPLNPPANAVSCVPIFRKPYFAVSRGDANASGVFNCTASPTGTINAFNRGSTGVPNWAGAGAQIGSFAAGTIEGFTSSISGKPKALTFANTDASQIYGGGWSLKYCIPDYWQGVTSNADVNFAGETKIETNGDVFIANDATLPSAGLAVNTMPSRWVIADNIYISNNVRNLDGIFVAKHKIYTCATGNAAAPSPVAVANIVAGCTNQLTINGALIAGDSVKFQRTFGSLATSPAENIVYTPEVWLQALLPSNNPGGVNHKWDAITILPPVL